MAEPKTRAQRLNSLFPWLLHWSIEDERISGFRSDAYALRSPIGLLLVDALPLTEELENGLGDVAGIFLTHGNHQRSAWRLRREAGAPVHAPVDAKGLDEEPDQLFDEGSVLPGGLLPMRASGFEAACYLGYEHEDGTRVLFCGDLICQDPGGPYRFPVQPGYFDPEGGREDARRLLDFGASVLCAAHAEPTAEDCAEALRTALGGS